MEGNAFIPTKEDPKKFIKAVEDPQKSKDCQQICDLMAEVSGWRPVMWGNSMVGFGEYNYKYASGHSGVCFVVGFSPRKQNLTLYFMDGFEKHGDILKDLGNFKLSKGCLYVKRLADIDKKGLKKLIAASIKATKANEAKINKK